LPEAAYGYLSSAWSAGCRTRAEFAAHVERWSPWRDHSVHDSEPAEVDSELHGGQSGDAPRDASHDQLELDW
jgi:hypothetical protein